MAEDKKTRVCPLERAGHLDNWWRRLLQNPRRILKPYIKKGMRVLDFGCGPGFFTFEMARLVGPDGHVIAADLQEGMLEKVRHKLNHSELSERITLHKCTENQIGLQDPVDFVLAYYVLHEVPDQKAFFSELAAHLRPGAEVLIVEPSSRVSRTGFSQMIEKAAAAGFLPLKKPNGIFHRSVTMKKDDHIKP